MAKNRTILLTLVILIIAGTISSPSLTIAATPSIGTISYDSNGVPIVYYGSTWGWQYNPVTTSQTAMKHYTTFKQTGNAAEKQLLINDANWLVSNASSVGNYSLLYYRFDFTYGMTAPWRSGMAQGQALQALIEANEVTGNMTYLDTAKLLLNAFYAEIKDGGITDKSANQGWWYEEYADDGGSNPMVLNGMMYTLIGLDAYYQYTKDFSAKYSLIRGYWH